MAEFQGRQLHLVKRALAIGVLAIDRMEDTAFKPASDQADMKDLLSQLCDSETELEVYLEGAHRIVPDEPG